MTVGVYVLGVVSLTLAFTLSRLPQSFGQVMATTLRAMKVMADRQLDDDAKERAIQLAALNLLRQTAVITLKATLTIAAALLPFWLANMLTLVSWEDSIDFASRWDVLAFTTLFMIGSWLIWKRWPTDNT